MKIPAAAMRRFAYVITRRCALLAAAAAALAGGSAKAQDSPAGTVDSMHGTAFAEGPRPRRALRPEAEIFVGDLVETEIDSGVVMRLGKATVVKLGALAKLRIDKFVVDAGGTFDLEEGPLLIDRDESGRVKTCRCTRRLA